MKKIILSIVALLLMTNAVFATDAEQQAASEEVTQPVKEIVEVKAKVTEVGETKDVDNGGITDKVQYLTVKIKEGEYKDESFDATYILSYDLDNKILAYELDKGNTVFVQLELENGEVKNVVVQELVRHNYIIAMLCVFFGIILIIGKKQGLKAILAFIITILAIYFIMITNIYKGYSPILMSIIASAIIILVSFLIITGLNKKSLTAALGTLGGVIFAGLIAFLFGNMAKLTGGQSEAIMLSMNTQNIVFNFRELLFAGIVIAALGACMDVGMSIASSLDELKHKKPDMTWKELLKSGMNIGSDVMGTMTNTIILAYVGGALNLILLFIATDMGIIEVLNKETIVTEIMSALAASTGVIFTIPTTSLIYALLNKEKIAYKQKTDTKIDGNRSLKL